MANRTMAAKRLKEKKQRRAWAKHLAIPSGITPNRVILNEYKTRALGLGVNEFEVDEHIRSWYKRDPLHQLTPGQEEVAKLSREMRLRQPGLMFFDLFNNDAQRYICWRNADGSCWVIQYINKRKDMLFTSVEYPNKAAALAAYNNQKLRWAHHEPYAPVQSGLCPPLIATGG